MEVPEDMMRAALAVTFVLALAALRRHEDRHRDRHDRRDDGRP